MKNKKTKDTISSTINAKLVFIKDKDEDDKELFKRPRELVMFKDGIAKVTSKETIEKMDEMMNAMNPKNKEINWVCSACGQKALKKKCNKDKRQLAYSTWHLEICDVCKEERAVTEHRDFGYCEF